MSLVQPSPYNSNHSKVKLPGVNSILRHENNLSPQFHPHHNSQPDIHHPHQQQQQQQQVLVYESNSPHYPQYIQPPQVPVPIPPQPRRQQQQQPQIHYAPRQPILVPLNEMTQIHQNNSSNLAVPYDYYQQQFSSPQPPPPPHLVPQPVYYINAYSTPMMGFVQAPLITEDLESFPKISTAWSIRDDNKLRYLKEKQNLGWREIASHFPRRTPNACQFRWRRLVAGIVSPKTDLNLMRSNSKIGQAAKRKSLTKEDR